MCFIGEYFVIGIGKFVVLLVRIFEREIVILNCDLLCFLLLLSGRRAVVSDNINHVLNCTNCREPP